MEIKVLKNREIDKDLAIKEGQIYEVADIVGKDYIIEVPMKQKNKFRRVLINKDEAELIEDNV